MCPMNILFPVLATSNKTAAWIMVIKAKKGQTKLQDYLLYCFLSGSVIVIRPPSWTLNAACVLQLSPPEFNLV